MVNRNEKGVLEPKGLLSGISACGIGFPEAAASTNIQSPTHPSGPALSCMVWLLLKAWFPLKNDPHKITLILPN